MLYRLGYTIMNLEHQIVVELFYYLKGGTVDYGEEHSAQYGHARFGKNYEQGK